MENFEKMIIEMEFKLLDKNIRNNKNELIKYISKKFIEYGASGKIYTYDDTLKYLPKEKNQLEYKILKIDSKILSENIILLLYIIEINNGKEKNYYK